MSDIIAALATPSGESAIAVLRISGQGAYDIICDIFRKENLLANKFYHGGYYSKANDVLDDVMFVFFKSPHSYTGEDAAEIYTHGNMLIVSSILDDLCARGCRLAHRGEFTRRAFLNGKLDLCQAEAVADVIHAASLTAVRVSQAQLAGFLSKKVAEIDNILLDVLALLETHIDFVDDEVDNGNIVEQLTQKINTVVNLIEDLLVTNQYRAALSNGLNVAIIGQPNAGKSCLLNLLLGTDRAIVSSEAGTTRDFISESMMINGYRVNLLDTAGLREQVESEIEAIGISKSIEKIKHADVFLFVIDSCDDVPTLPKDVLDILNRKNCLIIENKSDLPDSKDLKTFMPDYERIHCSVIRKDPKIYQTIANFLKKNYFLPSELDIVINSRHVAIFKNIKHNMMSALTAFKSFHVECAAEDIRYSLESLGEIIGQYNTEDMLDKLFSTFCIGK